MRQVKVCDYCGQELDETSHEFISTANFIPRKACGECLKSNPEAEIHRKIKKTTEISFDEKQNNPMEV